MFSKLECCAGCRRRAHLYISCAPRVAPMAARAVGGRGGAGEAGAGRGRPVAGEGRDGHVLHATLGAPLRASLGAPTEQQREAGQPQELQRDQPQDRKEEDLARLLALLLALARLAVVPLRRL